MICEQTTRFFSHSREHEEDQVEKNEANVHDCARRGEEKKSHWENETERCDNQDNARNPNCFMR